MNTIDSPSESETETSLPTQGSATKALLDRVLAEAGQVIVGQDRALELLLVGIVAGGHVLLEGVPGTAKTLMVRAVAKAIGCEFKRIQFTPDLMPADILGTQVYNLQNRSFALTRGPIFADLVLADEINRAPPKTQSALLEAMQERTVTLDGTRHALPEIFTVFATQNPIESEGTYPLPEAQLDRFLFKVRVGYPSEAEEDAILERASSGKMVGDAVERRLSPVVSIADLLEARAKLHTVEIRKEVRDYLRKLILATRTAPELRLGAGPRAGVHLLLCSKSVAALEGRDFVTPDDVRRLVGPTLAHRLLLTADAEVDGVQAEEVLLRILDEVEVPR